LFVQVAFEDQEIDPFQKYLPLWNQLISFDRASSIGFRLFAANVQL
jgi:hypothetical protein